MTVEVFLGLLFAFSLVTSLVTEAIKILAKDKKNLAYNIVAVVVAVVIGLSGTFIFYKLTNIDFSVNNIIYAFLMSFASGLISMVGYDKVKEAVMQLIKIKKLEE